VYDEDEEFAKENAGAKEKPPPGWRGLWRKQDQGYFFRIAAVAS
jgi:hypothetical protein